MLNARVMIHQPTRTNSSSKNSIARDSGGGAGALPPQAGELLAAATGKPRAEIEALLEHDTYYSAQGAVELGLVDKVCEEGHFSSAAAAAATAATQTQTAADDEPAAD